MSMRAQHIEQLKRLTAAYDFHPRDFLLTAPPARGRARERTRRRLARLLYRLGYSAHDLVDEFPAGATPARKKASDMDDEIPF